MSVRRFRGQMKLILSGLILAALGLLAALQWHVESTCDLYGYIYSAPTIWVVLIAAVLGPIFLRLVKMLLSGMSDLRATRGEARIQKLEAQVKQQDKAPAPRKAPSPAEDPDAGTDPS